MYQIQFSLFFTFSFTQYRMKLSFSLLEKFLWDTFSKIKLNEYFVSHLQPLDLVSRPKKLLLFLTKWSSETQVVRTIMQPFICKKISFEIMHLSFVQTPTCKRIHFRKNALIQTISKYSCSSFHGQFGNLTDESIRNNLPSFVFGQSKQFFVY